MKPQAARVALGHTVFPGQGSEPHGVLVARPEEWRTLQERHGWEKRF